MKILMINTVCGNGSTGRICTDLASAYEKHGHETKITYRASQMIPENCKGLSIPVGSNASIYFHALMTRITDRCGFFSKNATRKLVEDIRVYQPDVIHLHNLHGYYLNIEILFNYLKTEFTGKVVWTLHDCWAFTGHCVHYTHAKCSKWKTGCHHCPEKRYYPSAFFDNSRKNYLDKKRLFTGIPNMTIVAVSKWLKEQAEQSFLNCYPIVQVYNGIDYDFFRPTPSQIRQRLGLENKKMILSVSSGWDDRKGYGRLLATAAVAPEDWRFVIVGLSQQQLSQLPPNCIGMDRTWNQQELVELYSAADVFYHPSVEETFGLVTAEAIACGTPAVVMNSTACPEPLCGNGLILGTHDPQEAVAKIAEVATWQRKDPTPVFTKNNMAEGYLACYCTPKEAAN